MTVVSKVSSYLHLRLDDVCWDMSSRALPSARPFITVLLLSAYVTS